MKHFLNNIEVSPRNVLDFGLVSTFQGNPNMLQIDADKLLLPREAKTIIETHITQIGVQEGIPYRVEMEGGIVLEYYVDLTENVIFRDYEIEVKIKKRKGFDNFFEDANGTSFELLAYEGVQFNFINIPYLIIRENQVEVGITLGISLYTMTDALISAIKDTATAVGNVIEAVTPNASLPPTPPLGEIITLTIKALAQIIYTLALLVAVVKLAQQMFELIFPKIRYYLGCTVKELIKKGVEHLGYQLESNLLDSIDNWAIMPVPLIKEKKSIFDYIENDLNFAFTKGYPTAQDSTPTLGSLIQTVENVCYAETRVNNGIVQIEKDGYWATITQNQILPALNIQDDRQNEYTLNTDEIWKRTYIHWLVDYADFHTVDFFDPTDAEYSTEATNVINPDLVTIKGFNNIQIPFAMGVRKNNLNWIEKLAKSFFEVVDEVSGAFGGGTNFASTIQNRIGVTQIGQQFYSQTKMIYSINGKQPVNYTDLISAGAIYREFHISNEIANNDYKIFSNVPTRITPTDFVNLLNNNYAEIDGLICEILTIRMNDEKSKAIIAYKQPFNYADGKMIVNTIND